jgi:hypothetical protein
MISFKVNDIDDGEKKTPFKKEGEDLFDDDEKEFTEGEEAETENLEELEEIESKLEKGEDVALSALESMVVSKSQIIYCCPKCRKIFFNKKWVRDAITDLFTVHSELAYCSKCVGKTYENFVGSLEIFDKNLSDRKEKFLESAKQVEKSLEDTPPFEIIIDSAEKQGILFIFANTTRLAQEIGKALRQEFGGGIQYEWFERNQYLRIKWYDEVDNRTYFEERLQTLKDRRFGMFAFEEED